jgi:hypothetical protein
MGARLAIAYGIALILIRFMMNTTFVRALIGSIIYVVGFYGSTYIAYALVFSAGGDTLVKSGTGG